MSTSFKVKKSIYIDPIIYFFLKGRLSQNEGKNWATSTVAVVVNQKFIGMKNPLSTNDIAVEEVKKVNS